MTNGNGNGAQAVSEVPDLIFAEGDSWLEFPPGDVLDFLWKAGCKIREVAHWSHTMRDMAYAEHQLDSQASMLASIPRTGIVPRAVLLSGGGNDLVDRFPALLNDFVPATPALKQHQLDDFVENLRHMYIRLAHFITDKCNEVFELDQKPEGEQYRIPILVHGYAYPVPDGRRKVKFLLLGEPWLQPVFQAKGYLDIGKNIETMQVAVNALNEMLASLREEPGLQHVHYVDLRPLLSCRLGEHLNDWVDELHPSEEGFQKVADAFLGVIERLPPAREI